MQVIRISIRSKICWNQRKFSGYGYRKSHTFGVRDQLPISLTQLKLTPLHSVLCFTKRNKQNDLVASVYMFVCPSISASGCFFSSEIWFFHSAATFEGNKTLPGNVCLQLTSSWAVKLSRWLMNLPCSQRPVLWLCYSNTNILLTCSMIYEAGKKKKNNFQTWQYY